jgi:hypothetical protein
MGTPEQRQLDDAPDDLIITETRRARGFRVSARFVREIAVRVDVDDERRAGVGAPGRETDVEARVVPDLHGLEGPDGHGGDALPLRV